ncbi:MAG: hypothetical protein ACXAEU_22360 [Candidatus Hodarchaeales archaeon]|jgi:tetrahydromethanopterin S-methyltransferase subunit B
MRKTCPICGQKNLSDPENLRHVNSKKHQAALKKTTASVIATDSSDVSLLEIKDVLKRMKSLEIYLENMNQKIDFLMQNVINVKDNLNKLSGTSTSSIIDYSTHTDLQDLVTKEINAVDDVDFLAVLDDHTYGVVVSFFEQTHGPVPIIVVPEHLREDRNFLVNLSDISFRNCQILEDFENESLAMFNTSFGGGKDNVDCLCFGFSLNKPQARAGFENLTLSILLKKDIFPIIVQFTGLIKEKIHEIHVMMNKQEQKETVIQAVNDIRKLVSRIILILSQYKQ